MKAHEILTFLHCIVGTALAQSPTPTQSTALPGATEDSVRLVGFEGCDQSSRGMSDQFIKDAFDEFEKMVPLELNTEDPDNPDFWEYPWFEETSAASLDYFGPSYRFSEYKDRVKENLDNLASVRRGWFTTWTLHVRCDDPFLRCRKPDEDEDPCQPIDPGNPDGPVKKNFVSAYTMHEGEHKNHINFCPDFFRLPALDKRIDEIAVQSNRRDHLDHYRNRAFTLTHELLHVDWIGKTIDYGLGWLDDIRLPTGVRAYRSIDAKYLSYSSGTSPYEHVNNVNNYVYYLLAKYIIHTKEFYPSGDVWTTDDDPPAPPVLSEALEAADAGIDFMDC